MIEGLTELERQKLLEGIIISYQLDSKDFKPKNKESLTDIKVFQKEFSNYFKQYIIDFVNNLSKIIPFRNNDSRDNYIVNLIRNSECSGDCSNMYNNSLSFDIMDWNKVCLHADIAKYVLTGEEPSEFLLEEDIYVSYNKEEFETFKINKHYLFINPLID